MDVDALMGATPQKAVATPASDASCWTEWISAVIPFETWLLVERRRVLGAAKAALHEASLDRLAAGAPVAAVPLTARLGN